jgi:hypothetical protein
VSGGKASGERLRPVKDSPQVAALRRFFPAGRGRLKGRIEPGFFGPDSDDLREVGTVQSRWIMGGLFIVFTWKERIYAGRVKADEVQGYSIIGWDAQEREYRMLRAANVGILHQLKGRIRGDRLSFVSDEVLLRGEPTRVRYCFDRKGPRNITWTAEVSVREGTWQKVSRDELEYA